MITGKENIIKVFNSFHDGGASYINSEGSNQTWKMECEYLAQEINTEFKIFWLKFISVKSIKFKPWDNNSKSSNMHWCKMEFEIFNAKQIGNEIEVNCVASISKLNEDGRLFLDLESVEVYDEKWNLIVLERLLKISTEYWDKY